MVEMKKKLGIILFILIVGLIYLNIGDSNNTKVYGNNAIIEQVNQIIDEEPEGWAWVSRVNWDGDSWIIEYKTLIQGDPQKIRQMLQLLIWISMENHLK